MSFFLYHHSVLTGKKDGRVEECTSVMSKYAVDLEGCLHSQSLSLLVRRTCKADAISASGRLASAPTSELLFQTFNLVYITNIRLNINNPDNHGKL